MTAKYSSREELDALWRHQLDVPRRNSQPFDNVLALGGLWVYANLPNLFSGIAVWISLCVLVVYSVWAVALFVYLYRLSHKQTTKSKRKATLLHICNGGLALVLMSGAMLMGGLQMIAIEAVWRTYLLGLYLATLIFAALLGYHWLVLPAARKLNEGSPSWKLNRAQVTGLAMPASVAALGVIIGSILSRVAPSNIADSLVGGASVVVAFVLAALGAGILCESLIFARSDATLEM